MVYLLYSLLNILEIIHSPISHAVIDEATQQSQKQYQKSFL